LASLPRGEERPDEGGQKPFQPTQEEAELVVGYGWYGIKSGPKDTIAWCDRLLRGRGRLGMAAQAAGIVFTGQLKHSNVVLLRSPSQGVRRAFH
jgi:hypothetical protein